ncbi:MAG TPA: hypothetical protein PLY76_07805 [Flavobacteriales bacterium]|nr:hypothetical protein [Flavobacteriales bacterium]HRP81788.1 hypothetical protein [Flavobacteriales bacterium]
MENEGAAAPVAQRKWGILAFLIVLLLMPIGHALMVLNEQVLHTGKYGSAAVLGLVGMALLVWGIRRDRNKAIASLLGLLAGILAWTGWVEFSFVWIAEKENVAPMMENGEVVTKPEYLVMLSSLGLLAVALVMFTFSSTRCPYFRWWQRIMGLRKSIRETGTNQELRPMAVTVFMEVVVIMWTFYVLLLVAYDPQIAGDRHPFTYIVAFGSLLWSAILTAKLMRIKTFDHALRYAIPTVIIFWNFVEVAGRWDLFSEIWVHPIEHWLENSIILAVLAAAVVYYVVDGRKDPKALRKSAMPAAREPRAVRGTAQAPGPALKAGQALNRGKVHVAAGIEHPDPA